MTPPSKIVRVADTPSTPWRNGGGSTRVLLAWPRGDDWRVRISVAHIDADEPFSAFGGVERWFAVLDGAGVVLTFADGERRLAPADDPQRFDGAAAPGCRLIAGATNDLNLMLREVTQGVLLRARAGEAWSAGWRWRAVFASGAARIACADGAALEVEAGTLLAPLPPGACRIDAAQPDAPMFWIGVDADVAA